MNNCPNCGAPLQQGFPRCVKCGSMLTQPQQPAPAPAPPAFGFPPAAPTQAPVYTDQRSRIVAFILAVFLGSLGIHNFYLKRSDRAVLQLLITVISCGFLGPVMWIWAVIEGVYVLNGTTTVDGQGVPLKE
ncbi:MAG: TM2 domain-containing protein [Candidatus Brocadiia bacterium]